MIGSDRAQPGRERWRTAAELRRQETGIPSSLVQLL